MKKLIAASLALVLLQASSTFAAPRAGSPLAGRWTLDVATLPMPADARPQSVSLEFAEVPGGKWSSRVAIVEHSGNRLEASSTMALDGTPAPATGTYAVDRVAGKMPAPGVLVVQFIYQNIPRSTRVYTVSADGMVLTETEAYFRDGQPVLRTAHFDRVRE